MLGVSVLLYDPLDGLDYVIALTADAAADAEDLRLEYVDNVCNTAAEIIDIHVDNRFCKRAALLSSVKCGLSGDLGKVAVDALIEQVVRSLLRRNKPPSSLCVRMCTDGRRAG